MSVSSYTYPAGTAVVKQDWQSANPCPTTLSAPKSTQDTASATTLLVNRGDGVIAVQASYTYLSLVSSILPTTTFTRTVYARPRFWAVLCPTC